MLVTWVVRTFADNSIFVSRDVSITWL